MDMVPILIVLAAVVFIGLVAVALRRTIRHDRAAIAADMDEPHEIQTYEQSWRDKTS